MQATIAEPLEFGWQPDALNRWRAPGGEMEAVVTNDSWTKTAVVDYFRQTVEQALWREAAQHFAGGGLESGRPGFGPARRAVNYLNKHGPHA